MNRDDSPHWTQTERIWSGAAVSSLDVRRLVAAAALHGHRKGWAGWVVVVGRRIEHAVRQWLLRGL